MTTELNAPLLLERYRPDTLIARGGSASVYRARDVHLGRDVAIKVFLAGSEESLDRAREELRVLAGLGGHHGIVSVLDAGIDESSPDDPRPFLVMELVTGSSLRKLIDDAALTPKIVGGIAFEIAEALEYVHRSSIVHRDVSPANILLVDYGSEFSRPRARLTDFGLAVDGEKWEPPEDGFVDGTVPYLSPEQVLAQRLTPASDIFSLGLVLVECLSGVRVFPGSDAVAAMSRVGAEPEVPKGVPKPWRTLLAAMIREDPAQRPSALEVLGHVRQILRKHTT
ncbi:serine/threonine-protein kinase [Pseudolysinimonas sp.]|uniref:serine/threonine-protein kinase n=1 Tax=Pseudolysinimonas sp. TaxID=2680009 RepID=UPI00378478D8